MTDMYYQGHPIEQEDDAPDPPVTHHVVLIHGATDAIETVPLSTTRRGAIAYANAVVHERGLDYAHVLVARVRPDGSETGIYRAK